LVVVVGALADEPSPQCRELRSGAADETLPSLPKPVVEIKSADGSVAKEVNLPRGKNISDSTTTGGLGKRRGIG